MTRQERLERSRIYLILDTQVTDYGRCVEVARAALEGGVDIVQLRDKKGSARDMLDASRKLKRCLDGKALFIINDRVNLALSADADGVHLGQEDLPVAEARSLAGKDFLIGSSAQKIAQAVRAQNDGADYIGFGSVFKTLTKPRRKPMDLRLLARVHKEITIPVFAIGGITATRIPQLGRYGVRRVAVCREICLNKDVTAITALLKNRLYESVMNNGVKD